MTKYHVGGRMQLANWGLALVLGATAVYAAVIMRTNTWLGLVPPSDLLPSAALPAVRRFKRKHGGLWVGGTVVVTDGGVSFAPNGLNRAFHDDLETISVRARDSRAVRHELGWFTGIVVVTHAGGEFRFRCYGAKKLAATLAAAFGKQRSHAQA